MAVDPPTANRLAPAIARTLNSPGGGGVQ